MRYWKSARRAGAAGAVVALALALCGCGAVDTSPPGLLEVRGARVAADSSAPVLELGLDCRLGGTAQDALQHGIPITLRIDLQAGRWPRAVQAAHSIELRYFPLSRRYQLRENGGPETRSFATAAYLFSALGALRFDLPPEFSALPPSTPLRVNVELDPAALPGPLRLPALFEPAWRLASPEYAWTAAAP